MYQTSDEYKNLVYADSTQHLLKIYIEGEEVNPNHIFDFKISHSLFSNDEFVFGNVTAKSIEFRIHKASLPVTYQNFYVETGIGSEVIPIGYFRLDSIGKEDDDTITINAIDDMVKFEFSYDGSEIALPATMMEVLKDICLKAGVECGSTSFLNDDKQIAVYDNTISAREYLSYIAEQAGGFAFIGRDGKLYVKKIGENIIEVDVKYFQKFTWGEKFKVSRVAYEDGIQDFKFGDKRGNTIWINQENMYIVSSDQVENIYNEYVDFECYSFEGITIIDPALDVGDVIIIDGKKVIYQGSLNYVGKFKVDIESKIQAKTKEETTMTRVSNKIKLRRVQSSIDQMNGKIETLVQEVDENSEKISQTIQTVDGVREEVSQHTTDILNVKNEAIDEAKKEIEKQLEIRLEDYPTTVDVNTIVNTKAGEIETSVEGKVEVKLEDYSKIVEMKQHVKETINTYDRTISEIYITQSDSKKVTDSLSSKISQNTNKIELKLDSSKFTSAAVIGLINNRDGTSTAKINATNINLNGVVTANNYFKINLDGSMEATAGKMAGINIGNKGLFYSGTASDDGFGLWKNGVHFSDGSYIIFHAGANGSNISGAGFRVYQNGSVHATNMTIEGNLSEGRGLCIKGNPSFLDFYTNSGTVTTRLIDYGTQFLFAGNKSFSFVNISNSEYEPIQAESLYLNGTNCRVWTSGHELLLSCTASVGVVNQNNSTYMPIVASDFITGSSRRYKESITDMTEEEASKILEVAVKTFDYRLDSKMRGEGVGGVIAEEIVKLIPGCVSCKEIDGEVVPDRC